MKDFNSKSLNIKNVWNHIVSTKNGTDVAKLCIVIVVAATLFASSLASCNSTGCFDGSLSGTLADEAADEVVRIDAVYAGTGEDSMPVIAGSAIVSDARFALKLSKPSDEMLTDSFTSLTLDTAGIPLNVEPHGFKSATLLFQGWKSDSSWRELSLLYNMARTSATRSNSIVNQVLFVYVKQNVTITGQSPKNHYRHRDLEKHVDVNIHLHPGWNTVVVETIKDTDRDSRYTARDTVDIIISSAPVPEYLMWQYRRSVCSL